MRRRWSKLSGRGHRAADRRATDSVTPPPSPCIHHPRFDGLERLVETAITLIPGEVPLADWRAAYFGAATALDPSCRAVVEASARTVDAIVARHEPVYGINTGFGKLASVR